MPPWVYTFIAVSVTVTWVVMNLVATLAGNAVDPQVHLIMGGVVGGAFGGQAVATRREKNRRGRGE